MTCHRRSEPKNFGPLVATLGLLMLAGCGGGGGGLPSPDPLAPKQPASNFVDDEFLFDGRNYGLNMIGAQHAYAEGAYGSGVVVAVIDSRIDTEHYDLDDNIFAPHGGG